MLIEAYTVTKINRKKKTNSIIEHFKLQYKISFISLQQSNRIF
jgi:hypothetical protein